MVSDFDKSEYVCRAFYVENSNDRVKRKALTTAALPVYSFGLSLMSYEDASFESCQNQASILLRIRASANKSDALGVCTVHPEFQRSAPRSSIQPASPE